MQDGQQVPLTGMGESPASHSDVPATQVVKAAAEHIPFGIGPPPGGGGGRQLTQQEVLLKAGPSPAAQAGSVGMDIWQATNSSWVHEFCTTQVGQQLVLMDATSPSLQVDGLHGAARVHGAPEIGGLHDGQPVSLEKVGATFPAHAGRA